MQNSVIGAALSSWPVLSPLLYVPHTEGEYEQLVGLLDRLVDKVGEDESHPLVSLMDAVGC